MRIQAFRGFTPAPDQHATIASVPYDVVNREEAAAQGEGRPDNFIHVVRAEIDLPEVEDSYSDPVYAKAKENLTRLIESDVLQREGEPALYLYQQTMNGHTQTGLVATCHIDDYANDLIKKHEKTRPDKEDDRTRITDVLSANTGPVFLTYRGTEEIDRAVSSVIDHQDPLCRFTADDDVEHVAWRVAGEAADQLTAAFAPVPASYVADGHHRSASAHRVGTMRREANPEHTGEEPYNWFLTVLFPADQLNILAYNRAVKSLNGRSPEEFLDRVRDLFTVEATVEKTPAGPGQAAMFLDGSWYSLKWTPNPQAGPVDCLDVSVLQDRILNPVLGIRDPRTSADIAFVGGIRGTEELERLVDSKEFAVAFSLYPTTTDQLMDIADAGEIMPPKSTWFEPKLRSGLFIHTLEDA